MNEDVVGCDAGLAGVEELAVRDSARGAVEIDRLVDDRRALPTKLESDGREVLRRRFHDDARHVRAARIEDVVEPLRQFDCGAAC